MIRNATFVKKDLSLLQVNFQAEAGYQRRCQAPQKLLR